MTAVPHLAARPASHPARTAWWCLALVPVGFVVALALALFAGGGDTDTDAWMGGALLTVIALVAPVAAVIQAERAVHSRHQQEVERGHHVVVVAWIVLAVVLVAMPLTLVSLESFVVGAVVIGVGTALVLSLQRRDEEVLHP